MQKENQVLELQEEVTRLSTTSQRGGAEEVRPSRLALRLKLTSPPSAQGEAKKERAERNRRWENLIAEIGQLKVKVSSSDYKFCAPRPKLTSRYITDH